jgi:hypothetical protein
MHQRLANLNRLNPPKAFYMLQGYMERRDSGILGVTIRSFYTLAGNVLYEYKVRQGETYPGSRVQECVPYHRCMAQVVVCVSLVCPCTIHACSARALTL